MKTVTNDFKEQIKQLGREIDFKFFLHTNDKILTEDGKFLMTEENRHLVVEQFDDVEVDEVINAEDIYRVSIVNRGKLLSTMMKELDFEVSKDLRIGDVIGCNFGLKVNGDYEYIDYGNYMVYEKEFNEDTKTYSYKAYDRMLLTMQEVSQEFLDSLEGQTLATSLNWICGIVGLSYNATQQELADYPNLSKEINEGTFTGMQMTYRDVLDMIAQALGLSMIVEGNYLRLKPLNDTPVATINEQSLKDTNVSFGEKYMINSVVLSRSEDNDNIYRRDEESVAENGVHEYKIKDNLIMLYDDREDYIDEIFEQLNGLEYYVNDYTSTGITYLDWLDFYNVEIGDKTYKCLMLNDEINIEQGLEESVYSEMPEETVTNYKTSSKTDKEVSFIVDKQNGRISGKVSQDDIIASLNVAVEDGQGIVELKGNSVIIDSDNFKVSTDGTVKAVNGEFTGEIKAGSRIFLSDRANQASSNLTINYENCNAILKSNQIHIGNMGETWTARSNIHEFSYENNSLDDLGNPEISEFFVGKYDLSGSGPYIQSNRSGLMIDSYTSSDESSFLFEDGKGGYVYIDRAVIGMSSQPVIGSDERLKQEIKDIDTSWIDELKVKEFEYIKNPSKKQIGLIAQDYEDKEYSKYFLNESHDGYYAIAYGNITNALIQYCQEMKKEINSLKEEIKQLKESDK